MVSVRFPDLLPKSRQITVLIMDEITWDSVDSTSDKFSSCSLTHMKWYMKDYSRERCISEGTKSLGKLKCWGAGNTVCENILGAATTETACESPFSMVRGLDRAGTTVAQEIGHNLGMEHDPETECADKTPFIMNIPARGDTFSSCSLDSMKQVMNANIHKDCMTDRTTSLGNTGVKRQNVTTGTSFLYLDCLRRPSFISRSCANISAAYALEFEWRLISELAIYSQKCSRIYSFVQFKSFKRYLLLLCHFRVGIFQHELLQLLLAI
jgi:hypothetical protein